MVAEVWLHIGTPKSGTSSLQKHLSGAGLADLAYIAPPGKQSSNDLAIALNKGRPDLTTIAQGLNAQLAERPERIGVISSEMFYGIAPERLLALLPALADRPLNVLVYLRRQDRYIEAMYLQKSKNFRFVGSIGDYIARFDGSGSDYAAHLAGWQDHPHARLVPRVLERARLTGGDVVCDALSLMGLAPPERVEPEVNVSPGYHRVQLLQAAAAVGIADPRKLQRRLAARYPQAPEERSPVMSLAERRAYLARYAEGNAALCARHFPGQARLFDESDLETDEEPAGIPAFTDGQLQEIMRLLEVIRTFS